MSPAIDRLLAEAVEHHRQRRPALARDGYLAVLGQVPDHPDALHLLGRLILEHGHADEAANLIGRALEANPQFPAARVSLGDAYRQMEKPAEAVAQYEAVSEDSEMFAPAQLGLGIVCEQAGAPSDAVGHFAAAHSAAPDSAEAYVHLAAALTRLLRADPADDATRRRAEDLCDEPVPVEWQAADARALLDAALGRFDDGRAFAIGLLESAGRPFREIDAPLAGRVYDLEKAAIANRLWYVMAEGRLHPDLHAHMPESDDPPAVRLHSTELALADSGRPRARYDGPTVLLGGCTNYYHWLVDHLPLLAVIGACPDLAGTPLIVNADLRSFQSDSLAAAGISADRLVSFADADFIDVEKLFVPLIPGRRGTDWGAAGWWWRPTLTAPIHAWLRATLGAGGGHGSERRRLFVGRAGAPGRRAANEAEIAEIAVGLGYEVVDPAAMDFAEQVACFAAASHVAGVHGAGLTNVLFAPPGARLIEFAGKDVTPGFYRHLAKLGGLGFTRVACTVTETASPDHPFDRIYNDIRIDPDAARAVMA